MRILNLTSKELQDFMAAKIKAIYISYGGLFLTFVSIEDTIFRFERDFENKDTYHLKNLEHSTEVPSGNKIVPYKLIESFFRSCNKSIEDLLVEPQLDFTRL
jgi:hypothetical protein